MGVRKCCVGDCPSTNRTHRLFFLPKDDNLRELWLSFIVPTNVELSGLTKLQLCQRGVCQKHFDRYQFDAVGNRLPKGYPCLFSAKEMLYGIPLTSTGSHHISDHNYNSLLARDVDVTSGMPEGQADCVPDDQNTSHHTGNEEQHPAAPSEISEPVPGTSAGSNLGPSAEPVTTEPAENVCTDHPIAPDPNMDPDILDILRIDPLAVKEYGPDINRELASCFDYIATTGLSKETRKDLLQKYLVPINCKHISAPQLNPEIRAATPEYVQKRDKAVEVNQKEIAAAISCISQIITAQINNNHSRDNEVLKKLMDVGRTLCDVQYQQSSARRNHVLYSLKKELREQLNNTKIDEFLFGQNLAETLKTAKAVSRSCSELKAESVKKPKRGRNLNRKSGSGNRRPAPGPPRQQPPAAMRATTSYQPPPPPPNTRTPYSSASSYRPRQMKRR